MDTSTAQFQKIIFKLTVDADGYPPVEYESMWGVQRGADVYQLDNTPYYPVSYTHLTLPTTPYV